MAEPELIDWRLSSARAGRLSTQICACSCGSRAFMGALARVPIRLWPLAYGILIRALSSLDRALSNIFEWRL